MVRATSLTVSTVSLTADGKRLKPLGTSGLPVPPRFIAVLMRDEFSALNCLRSINDRLIGQRAKTFVQPDIVCRIELRHEDADQLFFRINEEGRVKESAPAVEAD